MSFPPYPKYKASGVEWLGDVPEHWTVPQIKRTTYLKARVGWKGLTSEEFRENAFAYLVTGSDFRGKFVEWDKCYQVERDRYEDDPFIQLENGDLLITKDGTIGKLAIVSGLDRPACLNSGIFVARPRNTYSSAFMYWILSSRVFSVFCELESFGCTINHLYQNVFERFAFPAPPESEQTAIAEFLDRETGKIDGLVAEQRRLMELLKEKRQAVISHAVTKGLNPHAPMKPSGIEWLGDVPAGWTVIQIRQVSKLESGHTPSRQHPEYWENCTVPWFTLADVWQIRDSKAEYLFNTKEKISELGLANSSARLLPKNTVILSRTASVGFSGIMGVDMATTQDFANWICGPRLQPEFLLYVLRAMDGEFRHLMVGSTHNTIYMPDIKSLRFALPSREQQMEIVQHVRAMTQAFDTLTAEAQRAIDLLQERRTALISAAVTGQIDVRQQPRN